MVEPIHIQALHLRSTASTFILAHYTNFSMMLVFPAQCLASSHHQIFWNLLDHIYDSRNRWFCSRRWGWEELHNPPTHPRVSFTSPFSPWGIFLHLPSHPKVSFTSPFSSQGIFYIPLLTPGYLLHSPSHTRVSFTFPFSPQGIFYPLSSQDVIYIPLLTLACLLQPPSHSRVSFTSLFSLYIPLLAPMYLLHSPSSPYVSFYIPLLAFTSPFLPLRIFYIPLLAPTYLLHSPSCPYVSFTSPFSRPLNQANLETLSQRRQSITTKLFDSITCNSDHKLYKLLPPQNNCVHFSYTFLILLLDFTIVTINLIQLLAAILIRINYLLLVTPRYLLHPPSHPSTSLTSLSSSINTHTNRHISRRLSTDSGLVCILITDNKDKYLGNS